MRARHLGAFAAFLLATPAFVYAASCDANVGAAVTLKAEPADPDVMVWDSRERLVAYVEGHWSSSREVMSHTFIARPGTGAQVIACIRGIAHPRSDAERDAIGLRLTSGPFRGHYGWVLSSDVHLSVHQAHLGTK